MRILNGVDVAELPRSRRSPRSWTGAGRPPRALTRADRLRADLGRLLTLLLLLLPACLQATPQNLAVLIEPAAPLPGEALTAVVDTPPTGSFGDLTFEYQWIEDGSVRADLTEATVPGSEVHDAEHWRVVVLPFGDGVEGLAATFEVTVQGDDSPDPDVDGDGVPASLDCDDDDPDRWPAAPEACDGIDRDCDPSFPVGDVDSDGDGVPLCDDDCDDADPDRYPGNPDRTCIDGGASSDCVPFEPAELSLWRPDRDRDTDGSLDPATWLSLCPDDPPGDYDGGNYVTADDPATDCDDYDAGLHGLDSDGDGISSCDGDVHPDGSSADDRADLTPGATELCDAEDNDLDGLVDEGFDSDGDGAMTDSVAADCGAVYLAEELDCDDGSALLNPNDADGDGLSSCEGDCDDGDLAVHPLDLDGDGFSTCDPVPDCDDEDPALTPEDGDGDSFSPCTGDCDDDDVNVFPGNTSVACDGVLDSDCDGEADALEVDADGDGYAPCDGDCAEGDPSLSPADGDGDGVSSCDGDCDDTAPSVRPGAPPLCDGLLDNDCNGADDANEADTDGDGNTVCAGDCDDFDAARDNLDADSDGVTSCAGDCDDSDPSASPLIDADGDGWSTCTTGLGAADCDDADPTLNWSDADSDDVSTCDALPDCDDSDPTLNRLDWDGDGESSCAGDCDDLDDDAHSAGIEVRDGADNDCDGMADEGLILVGDVALVELMIQPHSATGDAGGEYFELYNVDTTKIDLRGWTVTVLDASGNPDVVTFDAEPGGAPVTIAAGDRLVIARSSNATAYGFDLADAYLPFPPLPNGGGEVTLSIGSVDVDTVSWGPSGCLADCDSANPVFDSAQTWRPGHSMGLLNLGSTPHLANNSPSNWCDEQDPLGPDDFGSPGLPPTTWGACNQ